MFGMDSLTGGGGFSASSSATATTGPQSQSGNFYGGGIDFGAGSSGTGVNQWLIIGVALVAAWAILKKK
ncbi:hypothetical protein L2750_12815 [Shewanella submarina]|uniref:Uncharacterized protein n=1 Tax=Shewanella submarina TaxID=2016376 RepID=A0ABV7GJK5_9GAMM|nr:hypothetical protein [Shewanella submarina]MCL1038031.1 hypothetical protein [Shewanella submarina]